MAQIRLGLGQVSIVDRMIVRARSTVTPLVIAASIVLEPPHPTTQNIVLPAVGDLPEGIYYVDVIESVDGVTPGLLMIQIVYDLKNKVILSEVRYYRAGYINPGDPVVGSDSIIDPYLDGKEIALVYKEGHRPLVPPPYDYKEYDLLAGGGIQLLNGQVFGEDEVMAVQISYLGSQSGGGTGGGSGVGGYTETVIINESTTLSQVHRNKRLKCESNASLRLVITLESIATVPEGSFYYFNTNGGVQYQLRILTQSGDSISLGEQSLPEISLGKGEFLRLEKAGTFWEAVLVHHNVEAVGERIMKGLRNVTNTLAEDGALYDGDDYPRIWYYIKNDLPNTHKVIDDAVTGGAYVHPFDRRGMFVLHSTQKKFRMPNTQGLYIKGLKSFSLPGSDTDFNNNGRLNDYPGGIQGGQVGVINGTGYVLQKAGASHKVVVLKNLTDVTNVPGDPSFTINPGKVNNVDNVGEIYLRKV